MPRIELRGVTKRFGADTVLDRVHLAIHPGELVSLIGPSGSGKTTILRLIAGLDSPSAGTVTIDGEPVDSQRPWTNRVGMVFQDEALYDHLDVGGNVGFSLRMAGAGKAMADRTARRRAGVMGIGRIWRRRTRTLSGGERGVVALGRAIAREGVRVLLLDEPLARADPALRTRFRAEVRRVQAESGLTVVLASNDQEEAMVVADRVAVLDEGRIAQIAEPGTLYRHPNSVSVASFVGSPPMNLIPALVQGGPGGSWIEVGTDRIRPAGDLPVAPGKRVLIGLHPSELSEAEPSTPFERILHATVGLVEATGRRTIVRFGLGSFPAAAYAMVAGRDIERGSRIELTWNPEIMRLFDPATGAALPG